MELYDLLGITRTATQEEIKISYRRLALLWHPDKNPGDTNAIILFKKLHEAYEVLCNPVKRAEYDRKIPVSRHRRPAPKKPKNPRKPLYSFIQDAPPPKYDLWGRPLSQAEQAEWIRNSITPMPDLLRKKTFVYVDGWLDSMEGKYDDSVQPDLR